MDKRDQRRARLLCANARQVARAYGRIAGNRVLADEIEREKPQRTQIGDLAVPDRQDTAPLERGHCFVEPYLPEIVAVVVRQPRGDDVHVLEERNGDVLVHQVCIRSYPDRLLVEHEAFEIDDEFSAARRLADFGQHRGTRGVVGERLGEVASQQDVAAEIIGVLVAIANFLRGRLRRREKLDHVGRGSADGPVFVGISAGDDDRPHRVQCCLQTQLNVLRGLRIDVIALMEPGHGVAVARGQDVERLLIAQKRSPQRQVVREVGGLHDQRVAADQRPQYGHHAIPVAAVRIDRDDKRNDLRVRKEVGDERQYCGDPMLAREQVGFVDEIRVLQQRGDGFPIRRKTPEHRAERPPAGREKMRAFVEMIGRHDDHAIRLRRRGRPEPPGNQVRREQMMGHGDSRESRRRRHERPLFCNRIEEHGRFGEHRRKRRRAGRNRRSRRSFRHDFGRGKKRGEGKQYRRRDCGGRNLLPPGQGLRAKRHAPQESGFPEMVSAGSVPG